MVQQGQIDHLLQETSQILPPPALVRQAYLQDHEAAYKESVESTCLLYTSPSPRD